MVNTVLATSCDSNHFNAFNWPREAKMLIVKAEISSLPVLKHNFENMSQEKKRPEKS